MTKRGEYRPRKERELEAIEIRRLAAGLSVDELATKAGMNQRTYYRMKKSGRAFKRQITALQMALRSLETERRREDEAFPMDAPEVAPERPFGAGSPASSSGSSPVAAGAGRRRA